MSTSVKMMVSYGGEIRRCPENGKARYVGGENRIVKVGMSERLRDLRARLAALAGYSDVRVRYAVVEDGLDTLRDVESEHDLWRLVTLLYCSSAGVADGIRVRAFIFPVAGDSPEEPSDQTVLFPPVPEQESVSTPSMPRAKSKQNKGSLMSVEHAAASLPTAQSTATLYAAVSNSSTARSRGGTHLIQDAIGFEALAADSGFETLAAIAAQQSSNCKTTYTSSLLAATSSSGGSAGQAAVSGFEALAEVAQQQKRQVCLAAPVVLVPVALRLAVFYSIRSSRCTDVSSFPDCRQQLSVVVPDRHGRLGAEREFEEDLLRDHDATLVVYLEECLVMINC